MGTSDHGWVRMPGVLSLGQAWQPKEGIPKQIEAGQSLGQKKSQKKEVAGFRLYAACGKSATQGRRKARNEKSKGVASKRVPAAVPQGGGKHFLSTWNTTIKVKGGHEN